MPRRKKWSEMKCHEVSKKLTNIESEFEKVDKQASESEKKISELEREMHTVSNTLHSLESTGAKLESREEQYEVTIKDLVKSLEETEEKRSIFERSSQKLKRDIEVANETLHSWKTKCGQIKHDMDSMLLDVNAI